ncbi:hypothetical protein A2U01_0055990, partial [Trifolium medium]|nr:hypothetical protein [Trifolium medium]
GSFIICHRLFRSDEQFLIEGSGKKETHAARTLSAESMVPWIGNSELQNCWFVDRSQISCLSHGLGSTEAGKYNPCLVTYLIPVSLEASQNTDSSRPDLADYCSKELSA